jgi:hypothetical protein
MFNFYIKRKTGKFINQSLCWLGIVYNTRRFEIVYDFYTPIKPYIYITEGFIGNIDFIKLARNKINLRGYIDGELMFESCFYDDSSLTIVTKDLFNLYCDDDYKTLNCLISELENNKEQNIFLVNTEPDILIDNNNINQLAGTASGIFIPKTSYNLNIRNILFFDYSLSSLEYQKNLINNKNRYEIIKNYIDKKMLVNGDQLVVPDDINLLNLDEIDKIYDHLSGCNIEYLHVDLRFEKDIKILFNKLNYNAYLWLSNIYYYPASINYTNESIFKLIDSLSKEKNIKVLEHTRMKYESQNN